ncbi:hypothetical protein VTK56DRAFT_1270 [Thermocarpiscus australiensis]
MADTVVAPELAPAYAAPAAGPAREKEQYIQQTPVWVMVVRGAQVLFALAIFGMAAYLIHGISLGAYCFALVCSLFTWIVVAYVLASEKVPSANAAHNIWAVLALDFLMALFWLASLGANAALRATFTNPVTAACWDDGSAINSNHCIVSKRELEKRAAVANSGALAMISAIAGLSALMWLLFLATLVFHGHTFRLWCQENKKPSSSDNATVEMKAQGTPMLAAESTAADPVHAPYSDQQHYSQQQYPTQAQLAPYPQQTAGSPELHSSQQPTQYQHPELQGGRQPVPYQEPGAQPYAAYPDPNQAQYNQQTYSQVSPQSTPAPGQTYYPPHPPQQ